MKELWDSDNVELIIVDILPRLRLCASDKDYMIMAYKSGIELESDGETGVEDDFMGGMIKSPAGVVHDYIKRVHNHTTPDGKVWSPWAANALFYRIKAAQWRFETARKMRCGDINRLTRIPRWFRGLYQRCTRWAALAVSVPLWWP